MFLNVHFTNKINNLGKQLTCCEDLCRKPVVLSQAYVQKTSEISINTGIYCLACGLKEIKAHQKIALEHLKAIETNIKNVEHDLKTDFLSLKSGTSIPKVGDTVYAPTTDYINGGLTTIRSVEIGISGGEKTIFVTLEVFGGSSFNWEYLEKEQEKLKKHHGNNEATRDEYARG